MTKLDQNKTAEIKRKMTENQSSLEEILQYLPNSEYELILFMNKKKVWKGPLPKPPANFQSGEGNIDLSLFLYWLNNPELINLKEFSSLEALLFKAIIEILDDLNIIPATKMTPDNYNYLCANELIYTDGSVLSTEKWANFDQGWFVAFFNLIESVYNNSWYNEGEFPTITAQPIRLKGAAPKTVKIAIMGDWGTGDVTAQSIIDQITSLDPDYILHVGDVYYSGTPLAADTNGSLYFDSGEEKRNLLDLWPKAYNGKSFTLNSNHEMYGGANGYFYDALGASNTPIGSGSPFSAQVGNSCFALQFGEWTILGLDSAFLSSSLSAFMTGSIGDSKGAQSIWIRGLNLNPKKTIVITHHNAFAHDYSAVYPLWAEINHALNGDPYAWYWGHVHNGIIYDSPISIPANNQYPALNTKTFARCLGHGALPYGIAESLEGKPSVVWCENNLQPPPNSTQLYNGFALITLSVNDDNEVSNIVESFYDLSSEKQPVWTNQLFS